MRDRPALATLVYGLALATKPQAVFLGPFFLAMVLRGRVPWRCVPLAAGAYVAAVLPAVAVGLPFDDAVLSTVRQAGPFPQLTLDAPNIWQWIPGPAEILAAPGIILAAAVALAFAVVVARHRGPYDQQVIAHTSRDRARLVR